MVAGGLRCRLLKGVGIRVYSLRCKGLGCSLFFSSWCTVPGPESRRSSFGFAGNPYELLGLRI